MPTHSHNCNHFTGKTKSGDPRKNRKKKIRKKNVHKNKYESQSVKVTVE